MANDPELIRKAIEVFQKTMQESSNIVDAGDVMLVAMDMYLEHFKEQTGEDVHQMFSQIAGKNLYFESKLIESAKVDKSKLN